MSINAIIYTGVGYLGTKLIKRDTIYGTNLTWMPREVQMVPSSVANQMCHLHPDVYCLADSPKWERFIKGEQVVEPAIKPAEFVLGVFVSDQAHKLRVELRNFPKKESVEFHELVKILDLTLPPTDTRADMETTIVEAYSKHLFDNPEKAQALWAAQQQPAGDQ